VSNPRFLPLWRDQNAFLRIKVSLHFNRCPIATNSTVHFTSSNHEPCYCLKTPLLNRCNSLAVSTCYFGLNLHYLLRVETCSFQYLVHLQYVSFLAQLHLERMSHSVLELSSRRKSKTRLGGTRSQKEVAALRTMLGGRPGLSTLFQVITLTSSAPVPNSVVYV